MPTLTRADIVGLNRKTISVSGGRFAEPENILNSDPLDYILEAVWTIVFGEDRFPTIIDKAAAIGYHVVTRHVFHDGNKRTGLQSCGAFLLVNWYEFNFEPIDETERVMLDTAASRVTIEEFTEWVRSRTTVTTAEDQNNG